MSNYCINAAISILFLLSSLMYLKDNDVFDEEVIFRFKKFIFVLLAETITDCVFMLLEGKETPTELLYILKACVLFLNPVLAFLVLNILFTREDADSNKEVKILKATANIMIALNGLVQILGSASGKIFYIDEYNRYNRGEFMFVYVAFLVLSVILLSVGIVLFSRRTQKLMTRTQIMFLLTLSFGIFLRLIFPRDNYDFLVLSVSPLTLLIYFSNVTSRVDPLTQLLNRSAYESFLRRAKYTTAIIMIDINRFKEINDKHGHKSGDKALRQLGTMIRESYGEFAYCFRIGGDEFCAILKPGAYDRLTEELSDDDAYVAVETFARRLTLALEEHSSRLADRGEKDYLKYGIAYGSYIFYSNTYSGRKENLTMEQVAAKADEKMYEKKSEMKKP